MVQLVCDTCGKVKGVPNDWILGMLSPGGLAILSGWPEGRAVNPLAVHFCSESCKVKYTATAFVRSLLERNQAYRDARGHVA
jgi:hypothetical protein